MTYFLGRYYDLPTQLLLSACLKPGDRFIDIGANVGMITLHAAVLVGPSGRIDCVEPNPGCCAAIRSHAEMNGITTIRIHLVALVDEEGEASLNVFHGHEGVGTLAPVPDSDWEAVTDTIRVRTVRGDDVLGFDPMPPKLIKIDVEGYELPSSKASCGGSRNGGRRSLWSCTPDTSNVPGRVSLTFIVS